MKHAASFEKKLFDLTLLLKDHLEKQLANVDKGLSPVQLMILRALFQHKEMTQKDICEALDRDKSQIAKLIRDLENKGLVTREINTFDRRSNVVRPVLSVRKTVALITEKEHELVAKMLSGFSEDEVVLMDSFLGRLKTNLMAKP